MLKVILFSLMSLVLVGCNITVDGDSSSPYSICDESDMSQVAQVEVDYIVDECPSLFSDSNFNRCVTENASNNSWVYVGDVKEISCNYRYFLQERTPGINVFSNLETLLLHGACDDIDLNSHLKLKKLYLDACFKKPVELNFSILENLKVIYLDYVWVNDFDISHNVMLEKLSLGINNINVIDLSHNRNLKTLYLDDDIPRLYVHCNKYGCTPEDERPGRFLRNDITSLDLSNNSQLEIVYLTPSLFELIDYGTDVTYEVLWLPYYNMDPPEKGGR